ncbi:metallophosphoesterase family protein [bacterium]|nr:metallophosphoesterase family protein [bacterium]
MKIITISDIHSDVGMTARIADDLSSVDLVLISGDLTNFGGKEEARHVIEELRHYNPNILAVAGNCDHHGVEDYLNEEGLNLHRSCKLFGKFAVAGVGGSLLTPFFTPNEITDHDITEYLNEATREVPGDLPLVLLMHQPPLETKVDFSEEMGNLGSKALRDFIEERQPVVCFSGHIHEAVGIDSIGKTRVANPGPLRNGHYIYMEIDDHLRSLELRKIL